MDYMLSPTDTATVAESTHLILAVQQFCRKNQHCLYLKIVSADWFCLFVLDFSSAKIFT